MTEVIKTGSLKGKTLFITGASRGIGLAIGLRAAKDGANIVIAAKTTEPHPKLAGTIHTAAEAIEKAGGRALPVAMRTRPDTDGRNRERLADRLRQTRGNRLQYNGDSTGIF